MTRTIASIIAVLCVPVLVHALPDNRLPRKVQERQLPPSEYDHAYDGPLLVMRMPLLDISSICKSALAPGQDVTIGCSQLFGRTCKVMIATDAELKQYGYDYDIIYRHEIGHCNGWKH